MKPTIAVIAGGTVDEEVCHDIKKYQVVIGVDRGAWWLVEHKIVPDYAIGDFDSVSEEELKKIQQFSPNVVQYKRGKDETDLELGIQQAIRLDPSLVVVYGATGSRLDQTLAGISVLEQFEAVAIEIRDKTNSICLITSEKVIVKDSQYRYCSFLPITRKAVLSLKGFEYPLEKEILYRQKTRGISNQIKNTSGKVVVHQGKVLCIQSRD